MLKQVTRRKFLAAGVAASSLTQFTGAAQAAASKLRVGVIGHTGRGNYGHGLDTVWLQVEGAEIVGVADANPSGLQAAKQRLKTAQGYTDYRKMLDEVEPDIVAVCPRHPDQHCEMIIAAIQAGARGVYVEKPYCRTLAEADQIAEAAEQANAEVAIAHRNRCHPVLKTLAKMVADGEIGRLLEIRGRGKGDRRGGAEDLWVLGSHVLNLMHYFGGDPLSCSAVMLQGGRPVTADDVQDGAEALGPLAGNELHAMYTMKRGVVGYFDSIANDQTRNFGFGLQLIGSSGVIDISCDRNPLAHVRKGNPFQPTAEPRAWIPISTAGPGKPEPNPQWVADVMHHRTAARDLIQVVQSPAQEARVPLCDHRQGTTVLEMIHAVFASHRRGAAVAIPLQERTHPLADWT